MRTTLKIAERISLVWLSVALLAASATYSAALAKGEDEGDGGSSIRTFGTGLAGGVSTADQVGAEYALEQGQIDQALEMARRSLRKNPDDLETHQRYAEALEAKADKKPKDVALHNECVKEWLIVLRSEAGEEKGVGFHGIGISAGLYDDMERQQVAKVHLKHLVGRTPHPWETDAKYLAFAQRTNSRVSAKVIVSH